MAWALIIIGTILTLHGLVEKYREYKIKQEYSSRAEQFSFLKDELEEIEFRLSKTLNDMDFHRQEMEKVIAGVNRREEDEKSASQPRPDENNNFENIISGKFREVKSENRKTTSGKHEKIIALARKGETSETIAGKMDLGVREVELILKLYRRKVDAGV